MNIDSDERILLPEMNPELVAEQIGDFIVSKTLEMNYKGGVLGLSGGVDSTVVAALAKKGFDKYNANLTNKPLELVGYMLPSNTNNPDDAKDGIMVAEKLGIRYEVRDIENVLNSYQETNPEAFESMYDKGNLASRVRANILSTKSATESKILLGTGNKDEDVGLGYYTLFGDGAVHISPIGGLSKRLVRQMANYLGFENLANRTPTAGLEPGQTDFKDLGYSYNLVELVIEGFSQGFRVEELYGQNQIVSTAAGDAKNYKNLFGESKFTSINNMVDDIAKRHEIAKKKSELLHPPVAEVTLTYR